MHTEGITNSKPGKVDSESSKQFPRGFFKWNTYLPNPIYEINLIDNHFLRIHLEWHRNHEICFC